MRLQDIGGEFGWISRMKEAHAAGAGQELLLGIGDDAAVLAPAPGCQWVVTTDMLVEGVHFRRDWSDPYSIGWKAAAVNLSDIAAMGATPTFAFVSIAFTEQETVESLDRIYDGLADCLTRYGAKLAGGDTNASPDRLVINVTLIGSVVPGQAWLRSGAKIGDAILVTGALGNSAAGLALLTELGLPRAEKPGRELLGIHRRPQPRLVASRAAAATGKVRAAMDISDGLMADVKKLCEASRVGARIDSARVPISESLRDAAALLKRDPLTLALNGGEDFELLLIVPPGDVDVVKNAVETAGTPIAVIGEIVKTGVKVIGPDGATELTIDAPGWDHFGQ